MTGKRLQKGRKSVCKCPPFGPGSTWESVATSYRDTYSDPWSQLEDDRIAWDLAEIRRRIWPGDLRVLDLGCGDGLAYRLGRFEAAAEYVAVDNCPAMFQRFEPNAENLRPVLSDLDRDELAEYLQMREHPINLVISLFSPSCFPGGLPRCLELAAAAAQGKDFRFYAVVIARRSLGAWVQRRWGVEGNSQVAMRDGTRVHGGARYYSRRDVHRLAPKHLGAWGVAGLSALGGTQAERPSLWKLDRALSLVAPYYWRLFGEGKT